MKPKSINQLESKMQSLNESLQRPLKNQIEHTHHLHQGIWIAVILSFVSTFFFYHWMSARDDKKQFEANDIKYRALKVTGNKALLEVLYNTESLYNLDPENMQRWVVQEEDQLSEQQKCFRLLVKRETVDSKKRRLKNK